jgi:GTP-binding protein
MLPEIAFVGRSNAGKSSVINTLANRRQLAYASKTPGRTQLLNFFELSTSADDGSRAPRAYAVDLPGYGFAKVDASRRAAWDELAGGYLASRRFLVGIVLVMDARRPLVPADEALLAWLLRRAPTTRLRVHLLLNKSDQLTLAERAAALRLAEQRIGTLPMDATAQLFSARTRAGLEELEATLERIVAEARPG